MVETTPMWCDQENLHRHIARDIATVQLWFWWVTNPEPVGVVDDDDDDDDDDSGTVVFPW